MREKKNCLIVPKESTEAAEKKDWRYFEDANESYECVDVQWWRSGR